MKSLNNKGLTLIELMIATSITVILSIFTFSTVQQVIMTSMTVERKADFEALAADVRILVHKLDQCSCNFQGMSLAAAPAAINLGNAKTLLRYGTVNNIASCTSASVPVAKVVSPVTPSIKPQVTSLQIVAVQYIAPLNISRAILRMQTLVPQQLMALPTTVIRDYPLLFSMKYPTPPSTTPTNIISGCIGLSP